MLTIHHLEQSRSERVVWLMEALGLEYDINAYKRDKKTFLAPPEYKQLHPTGKAPVLSDGNNNYAETGFIMQYLIDKYGEGRLIPAKNTEHYNSYLYWMHAAEGSLMPPLVMYLLFERATQPPAPFFIRPFSKLLFKGVRDTYLDSSLQALLSYANETLAESTWFAGNEFTAADIMMSFPIQMASESYGIEQYAHLQNFLKRVDADQAYQRAKQKIAAVEKN